MGTIAKGFDETLTEVDWAQMAADIGAPWSIQTGLTFSINTVNLPRVVLASGSLVAHGVRVVVDAPETMNFTVPNSGTRYDLLAIRINWETNTAAPTIIQGGSSRTLPNSMQTTPGVIFDVPLLLVQLQAGQNRIVDSISQRVIASKVFQAADEMALPDTLRGDAYVRAGEHWRNTGSGWINIDPPPVAQTEWSLMKTSNEEFTRSDEYTNDGHLFALLPAGDYIFDALIRGNCSDLGTDISTRFRPKPSSSTGTARLYSTMVGTGLTQNLSSDGWDNTRGDVNYSHNGVEPDSETHNWGTGPFSGSSSIRLAGRLLWPGGTAGLQHRKFVPGSTVRILNGSWLRFSKVS